MTNENVISSLWDACHHYNAEIKMGKNYPKEIPRNIKKAIDDLEKYYKLKEKINKLF